MSRINKLVRNAPYRIAAGEVSFMCGCGLSRNLPLCDGSHSLTETEVPGQLYWYDANHVRHPAVDNFADIRSGSGAIRD